MKKLILAIFFIIIFGPVTFAEDNVLYGDLNGDGVKEKIIIQNSYNSESGAKIILKIFHKNKLVFQYSDFPEKLPYMYAKLVKFEGATVNKSRDVLFIVVGECDVIAHVVSYNRKSLNDGGEKIKASYSVKRNIVSIQSCY